jgi:uncharacterized membrane protein
MPSPAPTGSPSAATPAPPRVQQARSWALATLTVLLLLCVTWELWLAPTGRGTLAIKALPLALCVPGLLRHRLYTFRWLSLLLWLYVTEGLVRATSEHGLSQGLAAAEVLLSGLLFVLCVHYIRLRVPKLPRAARQGRTSPPTPSTAVPLADPAARNET